MQRPQVPQSLMHTYKQIFYKNLSLVQAYDMLRTKIRSTLLFHVLQIPSQVMPVMNLVQSIYKGQQPGLKVSQAFAKSGFSPGGTILEQIHTLYYETERYRTVM